MRLRRAVRRVIPARREHHFERGDPRTNQSLAETLKEGARSFDARKITPFSASQAVDSVVAEPTDRSLKVAYWILSAEVHIRAGNLAE